MKKHSQESPDTQKSKKKQISIWGALLPVIVLVILLFHNVYVYGDLALDGTNQFILLMGGAVAAIVGFYYNIPYEKMMNAVSKNVKSTTGAILILLMVGALAGTWLISGVIPTMIYYGLQVLNPTIFLASCVIICSIISISTGSSWTTSATVGIALIGIAAALDINLGMAAGAILSGAYFGDKLSPLSDTTNLAPAMAGTDLFTHIRYTSITTIPTYIITILVFVVIGFFIEPSGAVDKESLLASIEQSFNVSLWLFIVPAIVIYLIVRKTSPLVALLIGTLMAAVFALLLQPDIVLDVSGGETLNFKNAYIGIMDAITIDVAIESTNPQLNDLFSSSGMAGMLGTIWLIICAMVFGGVMEAIGALKVITRALLKMFKSVFGLFASTVASCLALNVTASDQYLAIVVPGKMFAKAYKDKNLAPENLSRTLEASGTVTSVLIPWNTCGAYHSGVLGVSVAEYFAFAVFNWLSPVMVLIFALFNIKIKMLTGQKIKSEIKL